MGFLRCYQYFIVVVFSYSPFITLISSVELSFKSQENLDFSNAAFEVTVALYVPLEDVKIDELVFARTADVAVFTSVDLKYKLKL